MRSDTYVEITKEELENVALESTRTIEIDEFVQRDEIDPRYIIRPYYLCPDGKVGHDAFHEMWDDLERTMKSVHTWPRRRQLYFQHSISLRWRGPQSGPITRLPVLTACSVT
jgi:hypothetical protein